MTADELQARYDAGERDFTGADLSGANLTDADLRWTNLTDAELSGAFLWIGNRRVTL